MLCQINFAFLEIFLLNFVLNVVVYFSQLTLGFLGFPFCHLLLLGFLESNRSRTS